MSTSTVVQLMGEVHRLTDERDAYEREVERLTNELAKANARIDELKNALNDLLKAVAR